MTKFQMATLEHDRKIAGNHFRFPCLPMLSHPAYAAGFQQRPTLSATIFPINFPDPSLVAPVQILVPADEGSDDIGRPDMAVDFRPCNLFPGKPLELPAIGFDGFPLIYPYAVPPQSAEEKLRSPDAAPVPTPCQSQIRIAPDSSRSRLSQWKSP